MGKSPKNDYTPPAENPAPSGEMVPTPGGGAPAWQSILPQNGAPAQLGDQFRSEAASNVFASPSAPANANPPAGAATSAAGGAVPAAVANLPPEQRQQYMAAKAAGNDELAARILLAATMNNRDSGDGFMGRGPGGGAGMRSTGGTPGRTGFGGWGSE